MPYYCYIIYSKTRDKYYIGYTEDVDKRITQHNDGISTFTAIAQDWELVYKEMFSTREKAFKREQEIKRKKSRKYIEWLCSAG
ncbi:GIY-YIG nuclease family protein [Chitinophagaceae bacterium MMS25-I14]